MHGGFDNIKNVRRNPELRLKEATWNKLIDDIFFDLQWKKQSIKNSANRKKIKYLSFHGTYWYVNSRYKKMNPETNEVSGIIRTICITKMIEGGRMRKLDLHMKN